jgi:hypothetical protein
MTPQEVLAADLPNFNGLLFDPETGKAYLEDGTDTGITLERAKWTGPFNIHLDWPYLNPVSFATHETALKVLEFCKLALPANSGITVAIDEEKKNMGPFTRTIERLIVATSSSKTEQFSAGWLARGIAVNGPVYQAKSWLAELKLAGFNTP